MEKRVFVLGEEWVYLKLYTGKATSDRVISELMGPFAMCSLGDRIISKWFFIRYTDEQGFHLRIRFKLTVMSCFADFITSLKEILLPWVEKKIISRVIFDTYVRELERYGSICYDQYEDIFFFDSACIFWLLPHIENSADKNIRWKCSAAMIHDTLEAQGLDNFQKRQLLIQSRDYLRQEFGVLNASETRLFDRKFRKLRNELEDAITRKGFSDEVTDILHTRKEKITKTIRIIIEKNNEIQTLSLIHMICNRIFTGFNRLCELTLIEILIKHYASIAAREKYHTL